MGTVTVGTGVRHRPSPAHGAVAHFRTDRASHILSTDAAAATLFGHEVEVVGKPLAELVSIGERAEFLSQLASLRPHATLDGWRITIDRPDGRQVMAHASVRATGADAADELIWQLTAEEATSRDPEERATAKIAKRLGHDLSQPLAAIVSYARGAVLRSRAGTLSREDLEGVLSIIVTEALRVADRLREVEAGVERSK